MANKAITWNGEELGASFEIVDIPAEYEEQAAEWREKLVESAVELDDDAMMMYLEVRETRGTESTTKHPVWSLAFWK